MSSKRNIMLSKVRDGALSKTKYLDYSSLSYLYEKCDGCRYSFFDVVQGFHPDYGYFIQLCSCSGGCYKNKKNYSVVQLSLF